MGVGDRPAIIYSMVGLIGRERSIVLCEQQVTPAGCDAIARKILAKIAPRPDKKSYGYEGHIYHFVSEESGLVFMCTADEKMSHRVCFAFLQDIRKHFLGMFADSYMRATECSLNERFRILGERMEFFSFNPEADKTRKVEHDLEQVQNQMRNNIDKVLDRGNRLETLVDATETLDTHTTNFRSVSTTLRRNLWWKNMKTWILLILTIFACIFLVTIVILVALRIIP